MREREGRSGRKERERIEGKWRDGKEQKENEVDHSSHIRREEGKRRKGGT